VAKAPITAADSFSHRALLANVSTRTGQPELLVQVIRQFKPDIIVLEEVDEPWLSALAQELAAYPHTQAVPRPDNFGIALYSRYPIRRGETRYVGDAEVPSVIAEIESPAGAFTVIATHPVPPGNAENSRLRFAAWFENRACGTVPVAEGSSRPGRRSCRYSGFRSTPASVASKRAK